MRVWIWIALAVLALGTGAAAGPLAVDGNVADWGLSVADGNGSNLNAYAGMAGIGLLGWMAEDQDDLAGDGGYLGPNQGGQNYDGEFLAAAVQGGSLFLVLVTGQRPDNGFARFGPGDIRIEVGGHTYGVEVGGGRGGVTVAGLLAERGEGSTYLLDSHGYTVGYAGYLHPSLQTAGSIWRDPTWILDPIAPPGPVQIDHQFVGGTYVDHADYVFTLNSLSAQHSVIELSIPLSVLGMTAGDTLSVFWRPSCGNDELNLVALQHMPEPGSLALLGLGGLTLGALAVRRRRSR